MKKLILIFAAAVALSSCEKKSVSQRAQVEAAEQTAQAEQIPASEQPQPTKQTEAPAKNDAFAVQELDSRISGRFISSDGSEIPIRRTPFDESDVIVRERKGEFGGLVEEAFRIPSGMAFNDGQSAYRLTGMTEEKATLGGISDYWYRIDISLMVLAGEFWVFGGYVSFDGEPPLPAAYGEKSRPTDALDIVFADGTATAWREGLTLTREQKEAAVAVIFYRGTECSNDGRERLLGVGLVHEKDGRAWCTEDANAYGMNIDTIQCDANGGAGNLTFEGDLDGSDNLSQIGAYLAAHGNEDDTADAQMYPAFHYAKDYAAQADSRVAGSPFADGWYLPALAELFQIWKNREGVDTASDLCGGDEFGKSVYYWSSSQRGSIDDHAFLLWFVNIYDDQLGSLIFSEGELYSDSKRNDLLSVCAIRDFSGGTPAPAQTAQP